MKYVMSVILVLSFSSFALAGGYNSKGHSPKLQEQCAAVFEYYGTAIKLGMPDNILPCYVDNRRVKLTSSTTMNMGFFLGGETEIRIYMDTRTFSHWTFTDGKLTTIVMM